MPLLSIEVEFLARFIALKLNLKQEGYDAIKTALQRIKEEEEDIEKEARALLERYIREVPDVDPSRVLGMIKKKLAQEKGIVL